MLKLKPYLSQKIWGGDNLSAIYDSDLKNIGEALIVSGLEGMSSTVIDSTGKEYNLRDYYQDNKSEFGVDSDEFPILVKIIDAQEDLSIQVHPSDKIAKKLGSEYRGKQECWFILETKNKSIIAGTNSTSKKRMRALIATGDWNIIARETDIQKNDFISIEPGVIHAIKSGTMLFELQQPSDTTFRLYDYDRLEDGKPRELHIENSLESVVFKNPVIKNVTSSSELISNTYFTLNYFEDNDAKIRRNNFFTITNIDTNPAYINGARLEQYQTFKITKEDNYFASITNS
ncbi:MAG: class I mannose-6-phosphate isomerase, partial [Mycoplasmataceae bacterium]|nr:class I mannose-6-phosphate isomerase [Mycoplasmataceae bacterium]